MLEASMFRTTTTLDTSPCRQKDSKSRDVVPVRYGHGVRYEYLKPVKEHVASRKKQWLLWIQ